MYKRQFRFVSGEMNLEEQTLFEERLTSEPQLALVLANVIELEQAVAHHHNNTMGEPATVVGKVERPTSPATNGWRSAFAILAAIAACLVAAILVVPISTGSSEIAASTPADTEPEFVDQWLETIADNESAFAESEVEPIELAMLDPIDALDAETEEVVPDWMFAAFDESGSGVTVE